MGSPCNELPSFIIKRLPVRCTFDNNYFNALYQGTPVDGYTQMVANMLQGIEVELNVDYQFGALVYRSVRFETEFLDMPNFQGNAAVNYTDAQTPWTRIIEHKWFEFGKDANGNDLHKTVISKEFSSEWKPGDEPYYPVNDDKNGKLHVEYRKFAENV